MTNEIAEKIVKGITDKIECNTADIDDWAAFWGFTREEYEEFLNMFITALRYQPILLKEHDAEPRTLKAILDSKTNEIYICKLTSEVAKQAGMTIEEIEE
jgi:hypothetical protein